ncbi:DEAD/DEAH box helicase [Paenibacillus sp. GCM10027627]|uniref:DEAD/DEAH box helicase n=1 Tax=unclassified Paenibacillus TaxID=185978 RepID=UPI003633BB90
MPDNGLERFHPVLAAWFRETFGEPTDVQQQAWASIIEGKHTLIAAPTGSGKTLAALLPCVNAIMKKKLDSADWTKGVRLLYITPLKALNNDVQHHIVTFMERLEAAALAMGAKWPGLKSAVRTGDTSASKRASMVKNPPDMLVTTPESLFILLTSEQGRGMLRHVEHIIVDEIHDLAADKRGSHLSLSLERLERLTERPVQRIGVSATQKPLWRVGYFLGGWMKAESSESETFSAEGSREGPAEEEHSLGFQRRPVHIVESLMQKKMSVSVTMPDTSVPVQSREAVWFPILKRIVDLMEGCKSALLFVNSRRLCERLVLRLNDYTGTEMARAHHGSMAKEKRLEVEDMLKNGELRCLVATSSLELGIDVGHIDLVLQIDSPLEAASGIQRIGRAGHSVGDISKGVIIIRQRGALPEAAVLGGLIAKREIEPIVIPDCPLDVLSQQTIAIIASESMFVDDLYALLIGSDSFRSLSLPSLRSMLAVLTGLYPFSRAILDWDRATDYLTRRGNTAIAAMTGAGTIPSSSEYPVHHIESRTHLGEVDEEFVHESRVGDVFLLGTTSWMIRKIEKDRVYVTEASNSFSEIPFWRNEGLGRSLGLGMKIGDFLEQLRDKLELDKAPDRVRSRQWSGFGASGKGDGLVQDKVEEATLWLGNDYGLDEYTSGELIGYAASQHAFSELPTARQIVVEYYRDMMNQTHVILLNPYGKRVNRTWLLAIQRQFETVLPYSLYGNAKDNGIEFVLPEWDASWLKTLWDVTPGNVEPLLTEAVTGSPLLAIAFRRIAETSLLLARSFTRVPTWQKRLRSEELLRESLPYAESFPFLTEAMKECLYRYLDLESLKSVLNSIRSGDIKIVVRETEYPSPMATQFLADYVSMRMYEGDGLDAATKAGLLHMSKELAAELFGKEAVSGGVSSGVMKQMEDRLEERIKPAQSAEQLWARLKRGGDASTSELMKENGEAAEAWLKELEQAGRVKGIDVRRPGTLEQVKRWIASDEAELYAGFPREAASVVFVAGRFAEGRMSYTEVELCERYPFLSLNEAKEITDRLLESGLIQQAPFAAYPEERIWTASKVASQMIRLSIGEARSHAAASIKPGQWCNDLAKRQHALSDGRLKGREGLLVVIGRLQGLFFPAAHWESFLLPSRLTDYRKEDLDALCAAGEIVWLGSRTPGQKEGKIAFFLSSSTELISPYVEKPLKEQLKHSELLALLKAGGASFLTGLSRQYGKPPSETMSDLLDLVWEGHASNDQFAPLRLSVAKRGHDMAKLGSGFGRWYWTGTLGAASIHAEADTDYAGREPASGGAPQMPRSSYWIHQLLDCYGIVTKELVTVFTPFRWEEVLPVLNKLEEWGTVTRGVFVEGAASMQFTTPEIAGQWSAQPDGQDDPPVTVLPAQDPANPYGLFIDWPSRAASGGNISFARKPGSYVVLKGGEWLYWIEGNGKKVYDLSDLPQAEGQDPKRAANLRAMFGTILRQQGLTKIVVERWNGEPAASSAAASLLTGIGAERDRSSYVLWMSKL